MRIWVLGWGFAWRAVGLALLCKDQVNVLQNTVFTLRGLWNRSPCRDESVLLSSNRCPVWTCACPDSLPFSVLPLKRCGKADAGAIWRCEMFRFGMSFVNLIGL